MLKKLVVTLFLLISVGLCCSADVIPLSMGEIPAKSVGVYQVSSSRLTVYAKPDENSKIVYEEILDYSKLLEAVTSQVYCVILPKKQLSYLYATDCYDEWVEVVYNKATNSTGWVKKDDDLQFLPWVNFYGMYGRKYGLKTLKSTEQKIEKLYSQPDENSKIIAQVTKPVRIRLTSLEGNWALVSILDITGTIYTGYIQWRTQEGKYFLFPEFR